MEPVLYPTLIEIPSTLKGKQILLRPLEASDAEPMHAAIADSQAHLAPWVSWLDRQSTLDQTRDYCVRCAANWLLRNDLTFGIFSLEGGGYLGGAGLHNPDWQLRSFSVGYWLRAAATGRGYATEAASLLANLAFATLQANRLELRCDPRNAPSQRVAERVGFVLEGRLRNVFLDPQGQAADYLVFSLTPDDRAANHDDLPQLHHD